MIICRNNFELTRTLNEVQKALQERRQSEPRDWVISRDEVRISARKLGVGAWGDVVEGTFRNTKVAVKQIHKMILSPYNRSVFEREMGMASRCRHPCLLQFMGATNDDSPLFITEIMDTSLRAMLVKHRLTYRNILLISMDVAHALSYLHRNKPTPIIHRGISSAHVLLWQQGEVWRGKVSGFERANFVRWQLTERIEAGPYRAPEALTSTQSPKVDLNACLLF